jgi:hypothetical protein
VTIFGEQYPKGLGKVVKEIDTSMGTVVEKMSFSLYNDDGTSLTANETALVFDSLRTVVIII